MINKPIDSTGFRIHPGTYSRAPIYNRNAQHPRRTSATLSERHQPSSDKLNINSCKRWIDFTTHRPNTCYCSGLGQAVCDESSKRTDSTGSGPNSVPRNAAEIVMNRTTTTMVVDANAKTRAPSATPSLDSSSAYMIVATAKVEAGRSITVQKVTAPFLRKGKKGER